MIIFFSLGPIIQCGKSILAWVILTAIVTILFYFLNKWYVRKLYGKHVEKLREVLSEMEND